MRKDFVNFQVYFDAGHFNSFQQLNYGNLKIASIGLLT